MAKVQFFCTKKFIIRNKINWVCHKSVVSSKNKKNQKSTVFLNLFQNLPSDGKQMLHESCNLLREHEKNNLPVWIALFPMCLLKFSLNTGSIRVKFEKIHRKNSCVNSGRLFFSCSLIYNKIQNWSSYQNRALSHRRFWNKFRKTFWFGVLDFRYHRVVTHSNKFRFRLVLFSFFFVMKILA